MSSKFCKYFGVCWRNWIAHLTTVEEHLCANMLSSGGSRFESWVDRDNTRLRPHFFSYLPRDRTERVHRTTDRIFYLSLERFPEVSGSAEGFPIHILRKMHTFWIMTTIGISLWRITVLLTCLIVSKWSAFNKRSQLLVRIFLLSAGFFPIS